MSVPADKQWKGDNDDLENPEKYKPGEWALA